MERNASLRIFQEAFLSRDQEQIFTIFPHIQPDESARGSMGVCIGFLVGLSIAGEIENANDFAESLIRSLSHLNQTLMFGDTKVPISYCNLTRDRTAMGFSFLKTSLLDNLSLEAAVVWDGTKLTINGQEQWYERYNGKVYVKLYNGGLLFHGLNNSIFAVSISTVKGWQIHT